jgi:hypothetical protein
MRRCIAVMLTFACFVPLQAVGGEEPAQEHWAFRPIRRPKLPMALPAENCRTSIDALILTALQKKGLRLNPEADRLTLIRRVSFDLTGLPPTLKDIDDYLADKRTQAYERMVEHFLNSPHYGERWGKYWLDAAGYADSNGYFNADTDRPYAWRYRDYVVRSFNADKPYDVFVREQLAGDEMAGYRPDGDVTPDMVERLTATHFLRNAPDGTGESDGNPDEVRTDRFSVLEGTVQITMNCLLGLTIQCARCHRHKFEPISQREYYGLQAFFFPVYNPDRWKKPQDRVIVAATWAEQSEVNRRNELIDRQVKALKNGLESLERSFREQFLYERLNGLQPVVRARVIAAVQATKGKQSAEQKKLLETHARVIAISDDDLAKRFPEFAKLRRQMQVTLAACEKERPAPLPRIAAYVETDPSPPVHHILRRGQHNRPGEEVEPRVLAALQNPGNDFHVEKRPGLLSTGRRSALARWITSPANPLFARVMVNRIWQYHFGTGIVSTPDNLGQSGARPTHPELLDYLAAEFVRSGWSIKAMHRLILSSAVYRQTSTPRDDLARFDADNRLLGRFPLRRLDAEALRDSMLAVAGELDPRVGGPYVATRRTAEGLVAIDEKQPGANRRSIYLQQRRTQVLTFLQMFDAPSIVNTCSVRPMSTVPLQALSLLNSSFARARSASCAARLRKEAGPDRDRRVALGFRLACGRPPSPIEAEASRHFLDAQQQIYAGKNDASDRALTDWCQMLLASNAFLYVE